MPHTIGVMETILNNPQRVKARRVEPGNPLGGFALGQKTTLEQDLAIARSVSKLMDSQFEIAGIKFGLDSIIGLVPVAGDAITLAIGMYPVMLARKYGLGKVVVARMMMNLGLDFVTGLIPVVGDAIDVVFKANLKNFKILEDALAKRAK